MNSSPLCSSSSLFLSLSFAYVSLLLAQMDRRCWLGAQRGKTSFFFFYSKVQRHRCRLFSRQRRSPAHISVDSSAAVGDMNEKRTVRYVLLLLQKGFLHSCEVRHAHTQVLSSIVCLLCCVVTNQFWFIFKIGPNYTRTHRQTQCLFTDGRPSRKQDIDSVDSDDTVL